MMSKPKESYILAIDQGTSGTGVFLYSAVGQIVDSVDIPIKSSFPKPGWVEQDPYEILNSIIVATRSIIKRQNLVPGQIQAAGITHQGESLLLWDRETGKPVDQVIVWQDVRSVDFVQELIAHSNEDLFIDLTGMPLDPEWPVTKIPWMLRSLEQAKNLFQQNRLAYSQIDAWLIYQLTQENNYFTDHSMAARSGLYNIQTQSWDDRLIELFKVDRLLLPEIVDSNVMMGTINLGGGWEIPLMSSVLDQAAALYGQACFSQGDAKITYGSCAALWYNLGSSYYSSKKLSTSVAWQVDKKPVFALVGETSAAGIVLSWLKESLKIPWHLNELSEVAESVNESHQLIFVSALNGLGAPHWSPGTMGTVYGITGGTKLEHFVRAGLESVAFGVCDLIEFILREEALELQDAIKVDGGMAANRFLMQFQADVTGKTILVSDNQEGTSRGVAFLAGIACSYYPGRDSLTKIWKTSKEFKPGKYHSLRREKYLCWKKAVNNAIQMYQS